MTSKGIFYSPKEKRYADYPRRYLNEYHTDARTKEPTVKGACATILSARRQAAFACDQGFCSIVRVFDRRIGQYIYTYKQGPHGAVRHDGYVR